MRTKKFGLLALSLVLVLGSIVAASAYFTDSASNTGNEITAGTLTLTLDGTDNKDIRVYASRPFFTGTGLTPGGDPVTAYVEIRNDGNMDMLFRIYIANEGEDTSSFADQLQATVTIRPTISYVPVRSGDLYGPPDTVLQNNIALSSIIGDSNALDNVNAAFDDSWPLKPGYVAVYKVEVSLPFDTDNGYQGATFTGDLKVDATQFKGQTSKWNVQW